MTAFLKNLFGGSEVDPLTRENQFLREQHYKQVEYIRKKTNQLLMLMGTIPIRPHELDDDTLIELDPIGIVADSFIQILEHEKELNERVQLAHDEIQAIISSVGVGILVLDNAMHIQMFNQKIIELFSPDERSLLGQSCCQAVCGTKTLPETCAFARIMETKRPVQQLDWVHKERHFEVAGTPVKNRFGDITHIVLAYTEITGRIENEKKLLEREQRYVEVFENTTDMVQCIAPDGSILFANRAWREVLGYSSDETDGLKFWNIISPASRKECMEHFSCLLDGQHVDRIRTLFFSKSGQEIRVEGQVSGSYANGKLLSTLGMFRVLDSARMMEKANNDPE